MSAWMRWLALLLAIAGSNALADASGSASKLFGGLPLELAIKQVRGRGELTFATFEDPNCKYCAQMAREVAEMTDVTIYTFIYPVLSDSSREIAETIWCAPNKAKAWNLWMKSKKLPAVRHCDAEAIARIIELGKARKIRSVPTIILANGDRLSGAKSRMEIELAISSPRVLTFQASLK